MHSYKTRCLAHPQTHRSKGERGIITSGGNGLLTHSQQKPCGKKTSRVQFACSQNKQVALSIELQTVALQFLALLKNWRQCLANQGSATSSASSWRTAFLSWPPYDAARGAAYKNFWPAPGPLQPLLLRRRTNFGALRVQNETQPAPRRENNKKIVATAAQQNYTVNDPA